VPPGGFSLGILGWAGRFTFLKSHLVDLPDRSYDHLSRFVGWRGAEKAH
jgi:hypothetical protein